MNRLYAIILFVLLTVHAVAQQVTVSGYITDKSSGETLISAEIISGIVGTVADSDGRYAITLYPGQAILNYHYTGYRSESISIRLRRDTTINVALEQREALSESRVVAVSETGFDATQMGAMNITSDVLRKAPVILGEQDILKTIQLLPGIQQGEDGMSSFFIRGGGADENMFLLDGVPLYNVSHMLGMFSAFTPESVKNVTVYKGAFPANYGGRVSGVVDVRTREGDQNRFHGAVGAGLLSGKLHFEGPIVKGKTTFSISGRLMHTALATPVLKWARAGIAYSFYDVTGKITHRFSDSDKVSASFFIGRDDFFYDKAASEKMRWGNTVAALRWHHVFDGRWSLNSQLSFNRFGSEAKYNTESTLATFDSSFSSYIRDFSASSELDGRLSAKHHLKAGLSLIYHLFIPSTRFITNSLEETPDVLADIARSPEYRGMEAALYLDDEMMLLPGWTVLPGLRYVIMTSGPTTYHSVQPRFSTRVGFPFGLALKAGYARMAQYVHQLSASSIALPSDIWVPVTSGIRPVVTDIGSVGMYYDGLPGWEFSVELYYKLSQNVLEYRDGASMYASQAGWESLVEMGLSRSRGLEFCMKRTVGPVKGWMSYTLSKTERCFSNGYINNGKWFPFKYDRRHVINMYADWTLSKNIDISASWSFMSGAWLTLPERTVAYMNVAEQIEDARVGHDLAYVAYYYPSRNNYHLPPSHALNVSVNLRRRVRHGENHWAFGVYNLYNAMNPNLVFMLRDQTGNNDQKKIVIKKITYLPIMPSISYMFKF